MLFRSIEAVEPVSNVANVQYQHAEFNGSMSDEALANPRGDFSDEEKVQMASGAPIVRDGVKVGRNDACPCGSGKKYKQCHGSLS